MRPGYIWSNAEIAEEDKGWNATKAVRSYG